MDGGAWWAAVYGVAQSRTRLTWLSSSCFTETNILLIVLKFFPEILLLIKKSDCEYVSCSVLSDSLQPHGLYSPWDSPGQNTGVGSLSLLQGIFPNQRKNPGLLHCRQILYQLSHKGNLRTLAWVAYPFSSTSSRLRNRTGISCSAGTFFTNWAIREAQLLQ